MKMLFALILAMPAIASAQMVTQMHVTACKGKPGQAFTLTLYQSCPPPGEAPPPRHCDGGTTVYFKSDDPRATLPPPIVLAPNGFVISGPIQFAKGGTRTISVFAQDDDSLIGQIRCEIR